MHSIGGKFDSLEIGTYKHFIRLIPVPHWHHYKHAQKKSQPNTISAATKRANKHNKASLFGVPDSIFFWVTLLFLGCLRGPSEQGRNQIWVGLPPANGVRDDDQAILAGWRFGVVCQPAAIWAHSGVWVMARWRGPILFPQEMLLLFLWGVFLLLFFRVLVLVFEKSLGRQFSVAKWIFN